MEEGTGEERVGEREGTRSMYRARTGKEIFIPLLSRIASPLDVPQIDSRRVNREVTGAQPDGLVSVITRFR